MPMTKKQIAKGKVILNRADDIHKHCIHADLNNVKHINKYLS